MIDAHFLSWRWQRADGARGEGKVSAETGSAQEKVDCYNPILLKNSRSPFDSAQGERGGDL